VQIHSSSIHAIFVFFMIAPQFLAALALISSIDSLHTNLETAHGLWSLTFPITHQPLGRQFIVVLKNELNSD